MYLFLLKKALPFTLTFIFGAALSAVTGLFGASEKKAESFVGTRTYECGGRSRMRRQRLVAESKPLRILNVPAADSGEKGLREVYTYPVPVDVTFGADGKVQKVEPVEIWLSADEGGAAEGVWKAVEQAARQIEFEPETVNGMPVSVTRKVEIPFLNTLHYAER